jgi:outer membrane protein OmpA-like peptidoglycan-associated protein
MTLASNGSRLLALSFGIVLASSSLVMAQDPATDAGVANRPAPRSVAPAAKLKLRGVIVDRDPDTFTVQEEGGAETVVMLTDRTSVKSKGGFLRSGTNYDVTSLLRGLNVEVEGRGNESGQLVASKIRFDRDDLKVARSIETRVTPVEGRLTTVEAQNRSLAGQVDELNEVSRTMKGDIERNTGAIASTNTRISSIDDYDVAEETTVYFKVNSSMLTPEGKAALDTIAQRAMSSKGYVIEIAGFTDTTGSVEKNRMLSQKRADSVVRYLQENHDIPLRRMVTPFGYGELKPAAENDTREGREQNRRVEIRVLVSRGITQQAAS